VDQELNSKIKLRLAWVKKYQELGNAGKVCDHFGISRLTLRKWLKRYDLSGIGGLNDLSSKPHNSPNQKLSEERELIILDLRKNRKLGARRIQNELKRLHKLSFAVATIHKVLKRNNVPYLQKKRFYRKTSKLYNCKIPGQRIQMDVCKIAKNLYQYTAIDDCTRYKIIEIYSRRTAANTVDFINKLIDQILFPIQRIQTDRGQEFFAYEVQDLLKKLKIKFRPVKPASPHLNGKVERTQRTDLDEFYGSINPNDDINLKQKLKNWQNYYNKERPHTSLKGNTPFEKYQELKDKIPNISEIHANFDDKKEIIIPQNFRYYRELKLIKSKIKK
jgi:transposase InsO family protein